jgi:type IV pilus assembly protein PilQ
MKIKMSIKGHLVKMVLLLAFLIVWPAVITSSAILLPDQNLTAQLIQLPEDNSGNGKKQGVPFILLAQNQVGNDNKEGLAEIVFINTVEKGQNSIVSIESSQPVQYTAFKLLNPLRLVLDFPKMDQGNLNSIIKVDTGIIDFIRPTHFQDAGVLRLEIVLNQPADYEISKPEKNKLSVRLQSLQQSAGQEMAKMSSPMTEEVNPSNKNEIKKEFDKKGLRGADTIMDESNEDSEDTCFPMLYGKKEAISLDFQNADVRNLFRIFAEISGFNVILSPEIGGSVNIRMLDVPWNQAMEVILTNNALGRECFGDNIVRVASKTVLQAEDTARKDEKARAVAQRVSERDSQDLVTEVVRVDHADINALAASLTALRSARKDGLVTVDARTNTLILNDLRAHVDDMLNTIRTLDIPTPQVLIEAKIVDISKNFRQELGIQWGIVGDIDASSPGGVALSGNNSFDSQFQVDIRSTDKAAIGNVGGFDLVLGSIFKAANINIRLQALESQGKGRVLSSPRIITADNKEARIESGERIPFQITTLEGTSIEFVDASLSLTVTPHVTSDSKIYMVIDTTKNSADTARLVNNVPVVTTREAHTEVLVDNGDTTVLGGIYESNSTEATTEVPFFSKIPLLGRLFRSFNDADTITELLVFITPTIIETN